MIKIVEKWTLNKSKSQLIDYNVITSFIYAITKLQNHKINNDMLLKHNFDVTFVYEHLNWTEYFQ